MSLNSWIETEFSKTGLPRTALAEYLGLDNAAVSRIARGDRHLTTEETRLAQAFFSVVASESDSSVFGPAVRRLRASSVRERVGREIARWAHTHEHDASLDRLLIPVEQGKIVLRADQIIALCRSEGLNLTTLVQDGRIDEPPSDSRWSMSIEEASRNWAKIAHIDSTYEIGRGVNPQPREARPLEKSAFVLRMGEERLDAFRSCTPFVVPDNSLAPQFEQGQTIYLEDRRSEPRKGDYVAILLSNESDPEQKAVVGRFLYMSRDLIGIESPGKSAQEIPRQAIHGLRRIAFCGF